MLGYDITVGSGGSNFGRKDPSLDLLESSWDGRDLPSTARWLGWEADSLGLIGLARWVGFVVLLDMPNHCNIFSSYIIYACKNFRKYKINNYVINQLFRLKVFVV